MISGTTYSLNLGTVFKDQLILIVQCRELLSSHGDTSLGDIVHFALFQQIEETVHLISKDGSLDLAR